MSGRPGAGRRPGDVPWCLTADQAVSQPTPYSAATEATDRHSWPTWRVTSAPARTVRTWRGATPGSFSVHVFLTHPVVRHRHRRFLNTSRQARPPMCRSRRWTSTRSCAWARRRHDGQVALSLVDSTVTTSSPGTSTTSSTVTPGSPNIFSASPIPSVIARGPPRACRRDSTTMAGSLAPVGGSLVSSAPGRFPTHSGRAEYPAQNCPGRSHQRLGRAWTSGKALFQTTGSVSHPRTVRTLPPAG